MSIKPPVTANHVNTPCPCARTDAKGRVQGYANCCGRYVDDFSATPAPDAESLMRSRYTAFVLGNEPYLLATWHVSERPASVELDSATKWLGLDVKHAATTGADAAEVEFVARYRIGGRAVRMHERSRFVREDGRWFYVDGTQF